MLNLYVNPLPFIPALTVAAVLFMGCGAEGSGSFGVSEGASFESVAFDAGGEYGELLSDDSGSGVRPRLQLWGEDYRHETSPVKFDDLPPVASARHQPWPGYAWSVAGDSINLKWDGPDSLSPAGKYAEAFGLDIELLEDVVSARHGIDSESDRRPCTLPAECDEASGETCAKRDGESSGYCIPQSMGLSRGRAAAAVHAEEPAVAVTRNGVVFQPNDIKALLSLVYDEVSPSFVSLSKYSHSGMWAFYPRPNSPVLDGNPGMLLVVLNNELASPWWRRALVEDRTRGDQVLHRPLGGFELRNVQELSVAGATRRIRAAREEQNGAESAGAPKPLNPWNAKAFRSVTLELQYVTETPAEEAGPFRGQEHDFTEKETHTAIIALDAEGYVVGGQWTGASRDDHPSFVWSVLTPYSFGDPAAGGRIQRDKVMSLYQDSLQGKRTGTFKGSVAPGEWTFFGPYPALPGEAFNASVHVHSGDGLDLYVRAGEEPRRRRHRWDCREKAVRVSGTCTARGASDYYVGVRGKKTCRGLCAPKPLDITFSLDVAYVGKPANGTRLQ